MECHIVSDMVSLPISLNVEDTNDKPHGSNSILVSYNVLVGRGRTTSPNYISTALGPAPPPPPHTHTPAAASGLWLWIQVWVSGCELYFATIKCWWITKVPWSIIEEGVQNQRFIQFNNTNSSLHVLPSDACSYIKFACIKISHTSSTRERHNVL